MASSSGKSHKKRPDASHNEGEHHDDDHDSHQAHAEHAEEGEPWLVSYADLMTLLFGFFVVMYSFAAKDPKAVDCVKLKLLEAFQTESPDDGSPTGSTVDGAAVRTLQMLVTLLNLDSIEDLMNRIEKDSSPGEASESTTKSTAIAKDMKDSSPLLTLKAMLGADDVKNTLTIIIPADTLFASGSAELDSTSKAKMYEIVEQLRMYPDIEEIEIVGHTDSQPTATGNKIDNWTLSVMRSSAIGKIFASGGLEERLLKITGRGSLQPLLPDKDSSGAYIKENMQKNRRIDIIVKRERANGKSK